MKTLVMPVILLTLVAALGCSSDDGPVQGEERGSCYPNGTCNTGLTCYSNVCVDPEEPQDTSYTPDSTVQEDLATGTDWNSGLDQSTLPDNNSCQPNCQGNCGGDDGCGGTCGCSGSDQCVHGFCIPAGRHWLYGEVTVSQVFEDIYGSPAGDVYDSLAGTQFSFIINFDITGVNPTLGNPEPPLYIEQRYTRVNFASLQASVRGPNVGPLATLSADVAGSSGEFRLDIMESGEIRLTGVAAGAGGQRLVFNSITFSGQLDGSGYPTLSAFTSTSGLAGLENRSSDGSTIMDMAELTGTFEYN